MYSPCPTNPYMYNAVIESMGGRNQTNAVSSTALPTLQALGILRDSLDEICDAVDSIITTVEKFEQKSGSFKDVSITDKEVIQQILTKLPPQKVSALIAAMLGMAEFAPLVPLADQQKQVDKMRDDIRHLQEIRNNLHDALDGLV